MMSIINFKRMKQGLEPIQMDKNPFLSPNQYSDKMIHSNKVQNQHLIPEYNRPFAKDAVPL